MSTRIATFESIFGSHPDLAYSASAVADIKKMRQQLENELFFDKLLDLLGIDQASHLYPAPSNKTLRSLYDRIMTSTSPENQKLSLLYYLLKDLNPKTHDASSFAQKARIPRKYLIFVDGIWFLDRMNLERALECLTEPALVPTLANKILYTLCRHCNNEQSLPLAYYNTVSPPSCFSQRVLDVFFNVLCQASLTEAFYLSRTYQSIMRRHTFESLIKFAHESTHQETRVSRAMELLTLPLNGDEGRWMDEYLLEGEGKGSFGATDTIVMRQILTGEVQKGVLTGKNVNSRRIDDLNWEILTLGFQAPGKTV